MAFFYSVVTKNWILKSFKGDDAQVGATFPFAEQLRPLLLSKRPSVQKPKRGESNE